MTTIDPSSTSAVNASIHTPPVSSQGSVQAAQAQAISLSHANVNETSWMGRTINYIIDTANYLTTLFYDALSVFSICCFDPKELLGAIALSLRPNPRARRSRITHRPHSNTAQRSAVPVQIENKLPRPDVLSAVKPLSELKNLSVPARYTPLIKVLQSFAANSNTDPLFVAKERTPSNSSIEDFKDHLMAMVNYLRGDETHEITEIHLKAFLNLLLRIIPRDQSLMSNNRMLLLKIVDLFQGSYEMVKEDITAPIYTEIKELNALTPESDEILPLIEETIVNFELNENSTLKNIRKFIEKISLSDDGDILLTLKLDDSKPSDRILDKFQTDFKQILFTAFHNHLKGIVEKIRKNDGIAITIEEQKTLAKLLNALNCDLGSTLSIFKCLAGNFGSEKNGLIDLHKKVNLETLIGLGNILEAPHVLAPATSETVMPKLSNIGMTCYMSSTIWAVSRFSCFDSLFTSELPNTSSDVDRQATTLLRQHLKAIVHKLRSGEKVEKENLHALYNLMLASGWPHRLGSMQDPQELLNFFFNKFIKTDAATPFSFMTTEQLSWQKEDNPLPSSKTIGRAEINYLLQLGPRTIANDIDPSLPSVESIYDFNMTATLPNYKPYKSDGDEREYEATKKTLIIGDAPDSLCLHFKRYQLGRRINGSLPIFDALDPSILNPTFTVPVYHSKENLSLKETRTYKLKGVICHQGSTINSGHYTFMSLQNIKNKEAGPLDDHKESPETNTWIHYNDLGPQKPVSYDEGSDNFLELQTTINEDGYLLIYEIDNIDTAAGVLPEINLDNPDALHDGQ
jgi:hypothetical protein